MNRGESAKSRIIAHLDVASQGSIVGKGREVTHLAIMRQMDVGHHEVVIPEAGNTCALGGAPIESAKFSNRVSIAYLQPGRCALVFLVLRLISQRSELENPVIATDARMPLYDDMRPDPGIVANPDMLFHDGISPDGDARAKLCSGMDKGCWVDTGFLHGSVLLKNLNPYDR